jgi:hypothetical protein
LLLALVLAAFVVSRSATAAPAAPASSTALAGHMPTASAVLSTNRLSSRFGAGGVTLSVGSRSLLMLGLTSIGRGTAMRAVPNAELSFARHTLSYDGGGLTESYTRRTSGLEQVFTIARRPAGAGALRLAVGRLAAGVRARVSGRNITLLDRNGRVLASYGGLRVTDAHGGVIPAQIRIEGNRLTLVIGDRTARYPLRVDPYVSIAKLTPSSFDVSLGTENGNRSEFGANDTFGTAVTESANGDVVVVGAPADNSAFVFVKPAHGGWQNAHPTARLEMNVEGQYPELGESVAVSADGKTIVVGEPQTTVGSNNAAGEALVYTEPSNGWSHTSGLAKAVLAAADPGTFDYFGGSVAMDSGGDTIVVGSPGWNNQEGALYLFKRGSGGWASTTAGVTANVGEPAENSDYGGALGQSISMSSNGDVIAVGAPATQGWEGAVYVFGHDLNGYRELADGASGTSDNYFTCSGGGGYGIGNPNLGTTVGVSADGKTIVAGEPCAGTGGQAVVYDEPTHGWNTASGNIAGGLTPLRPDVFNILLLGTSVAIAGNASAIVADDPAYAGTGGYVATFLRPAKGWSHVNPPVADNFGSLLTPDGLARGFDIVTGGTPLAVSSGGGNVFVGDTGTSNDGAVQVYELASDIASATTVSCSPSSVDTGKSSTCTATVKTNSPTATGQVSFSTNHSSGASFNHKDCTLSRVKTGTATCHVSLTPHQRQLYVVTAHYGGDNNHGSGTGTTDVSTPRDGTNTNVLCTPNPVNALATTMCTATVTGVGAQAPAVSFNTNPVVANAIGQVACAQLGSTETCDTAISIAASGTYKVNAAYAGDTLDGPSGGDAQLVVAGVLTTTTVGCSPTTIYGDQTSNCSATVSGLVGTATPPHISFSANGVNWNFPNELCTVASGSETCAAMFVPGSIGSARINASFPGDASNLGSAGEASVNVDSTVVLACTGTDAWVCTTTVTDRTTNPSSATGTIALTYGLTGSSSTSLLGCSLQPTSGSTSACQIDIDPHSAQQFTLTAEYAGDGVHRAGSDTITYQEP